MKKISGALCCNIFLQALTLHAQNNIIDSLKHLLQTEKKTPAA